jgi:hypothetical protein
MELQDKEVNQVGRVQVDQLDHVGNQDLKDKEVEQDLVASQELLDLMGSLVQLDHKGSEDSQANLDHLVKMVNLDLKDQEGNLDQLAHQGSEALLEKGENQGLTVEMDHLAHEESVVQMAILVLVVNQDHLDLQDKEANQDQVGHQVKEVNQGDQENLVGLNSIIYYTLYMHVHSHLLIKCLINVYLFVNKIINNI